MVALRVFLSRFRFYLEIDFPPFSLSLSVILIFSYQARIFPIIYHASDKSLLVIVETFISREGKAG